MRFVRGDIEFSADYHGNQQWDEREVLLQGTPMKNRADCSSRRIYLKFEFAGDRNPHTDLEYRSELREVAENFLTQLSVKTQSPIGEAKYDGGRQEECANTEEEGDKAVVPHVALVAVNVLGANVVTTCSSDYAKSLLDDSAASTQGKKSTDKHRLENRYREVLLIQDIVDRFLQLFRIIVDIAGDKIGRADKILRTLDPPLPLRPITEGNLQGQDETILTHLRNQVGHARPSAAPKETRREMGQWICKLTELTAKAIQQMT